MQIIIWEMLLNRGLSDMCDDKALLKPKRPASTPGSCRPIDICWTLRNVLARTTSARYAETVRDRDWDGNSWVAGQNRSIIHERKTHKCRYGRRKGFDSQSPRICWKYWDADICIVSMPIWLGWGGATRRIGHCQINFPWNACKCCCNASQDPAEHSSFWKPQCRHWPLHVGEV